MKSFFKKSLISMVVVGAAAGTPVAAQAYASQAWSPHMTGYFIGVEGLDLRAENGDTDYVTVFPTSGGAGSFNTANVSNGYHWGWRIFGGIKFTDNDDITLSWLRLDADDSDTTYVNSDDFNSAPRWLFETNWGSTYAKLKTDFTDIYGVIGHSIHFNNPWDVRFAGGFEYTKLNSDLTISSQNSSSTLDGASYTGDSHFKGFGPRVEFNMNYHLPYNFALFGEANGALLVGTRKISLNGSTIDSSNDFNSAFFSTRHVVVPKVGARLGASYTWIFGCAGGEGAALSSLKIDAGWQVESYVHAIERPLTGYENGSTNEGFDFAQTKVSNFGNQGLFIGLQYSSGVV